MPNHIRGIVKIDGGGGANGRSPVIKYYEL